MARDALAQGYDAVCDRVAEFIVADHRSNFVRSRFGHTSGWLPHFDMNDGPALRL